MNGQTYNNSGCEIYFLGPSKVYIPPGAVCPVIARMTCYVFNGGVCCSSECPGAVAHVYHLHNLLPIVPSYNC